MRKAKLINLLTGEEVRVTARTDHPASSYGLPVWVDDNNQAYCQCDMPCFGYEIIEDCTTKRYRSSCGKKSGPFRRPEKTEN